MGMELDAQDARYLMGQAEPKKSSVLISDSDVLNNPRLRHIYAQMGLKRNGIDLPDAYVIPEKNRALAEVTDMARLQVLIAEERAKQPEFAQWLDARFVSRRDDVDLSHCTQGTVGAAIRRFIAQSGMEIDFVFRGEPADDFMCLVKRPQPAR